MPESIFYFGDREQGCAAALPLDPEQTISAWSGLRALMVRELSPAFTRDEWAFLIAFLDRTSLRRPFRSAFGRPLAGPPEHLETLFRPRGPAALWLPNNVSLLGPLLLILVSLAGVPLRIKSGSRSDNLAAAFLDFALSRLPACPLRDYLSGLTCAAFDRGDPRNAEMARESMVRLIFGGDAAAHAIQDLPHPLESIGFSFVDRRSEVWVEAARLDDGLLIGLLRVFAIYGQTGCTSPRRVVLLGGSADDVLRLRDRLVELWPQAEPRLPPSHVASGNQMARQWAAALGWDARIAGPHGAVMAAGGLDLESCPAPQLLMVVGATPAQAEAALPANIQTIGHGLTDSRDPKWLEILARNPVRRFVPIARMHHFGPAWDGWGFWRALFAEVEIDLDSAVAS